MEFNIGFTKKQLRWLMTAVEIFSYITDDTEEDDPDSKQISDFTDYILGQLYHNGFKEDIEIDDSGRYWLKDDTEDAILDRFLERYNDQNFWIELIKRLGARDFQNKYGNDIEHMEEDDYIHRVYQEAEKYEKEFEKNGLARLKIG